MKKRWSIVPIICVLFVLLCGFDENQQKVYDQAGLLSQSEIAKLEALCISTAKELELDIVLVTTDDAEGKSSQAYADDFYDDGAFGYEGAYGSGVLMLIDMDNRYVYISTAGDGILRITDYEVERILDAVYDDVADGWYADAFYDFFPALERYAGNSEIAENVTGSYDPEDEYYDIVDVEPEEPGFLEKAFDPAQMFMRMGISAVFGGIVTVVFWFQRKTKVTATARNYQKGSLRMNRNMDRFLHTTVTKRRIETQNRSSGGGGSSRSFSSSHRSSGGRSHGGGGRRF